MGLTDGQRQVKIANAPLAKRCLGCHGCSNVHEWQVVDRRTSPSVVTAAVCANWRNVESYPWSLLSPKGAFSYRPVGHPTIAEERVMWASRPGQASPAPSLGKGLFFSMAKKWQCAQGFRVKDTKSANRRGWKNRGNTTMPHHIIKHTGKQKIDRFIIRLQSPHGNLSSYNS